MTELVVALPQQAPGDDEDVVWGLSTASALWARGERDDAVVWLRRAADAAIAAGQDFRASQLGMAAAEVEDALIAWRGARAHDEAAEPSTPALPAVEQQPRSVKPDEDPAPVSSLRTGSRASSERSPRQPILDPWSEGSGGGFVPALSRKLPPPPALSMGGSMMVDVRTRSSADEGDDVVSSAPPLAALLARRPAPPKPPPPPKPGRVDRARLPKPRPPRGSEASVASARIEGVALEEVLAFADLPHDALAQLVATATVEQLGADEEVSGFAAALVLDGAASVSATIVDVPVAQLDPLMLVPSRGTLVDTMALRIVAGGPGARIATWGSAQLDAALASCPWVQEELGMEADRLQALAGATMGPLGDLDDATRAALFPRLSVRAVPPGELVIEQGAPSLGLVIVGLGAVHAGDAALTAGELLFAAAAIDGGLTPAPAYAGVSGALLLIADRPLASALFAELPALLDLVSQG